MVTFIDVLNTVIGIEFIEPLSDFTWNDFFEYRLVFFIDVTDKSVSSLIRYSWNVLYKNGVVILSTVPVFKKLIKLKKFDTAVVEEANWNEGKWKSEDVIGEEVM